MLMAVHAAVRPGRRVACHVAGTRNFVDVFTRADFGRVGAWVAPACHHSVGDGLCACAYGFMKGVYARFALRPRAGWWRRPQPLLPFPVRVGLHDPDSPDLPAL